MKHNLVAMEFGTKITGTASSFADCELVWMYKLQQCGIL